MEPRVICEKYHVLECLHQTETNTVYLTEHESLKTKRIIKQMKKQENFQILEIEILKKFSHSNIPKIIDVAEDSEYIFLIREYAEGKNLEEWLSEKEAFDEKELLNIAEQLADVLHYLHKGFEYPIIYRDLKPENIILDEQGRLYLIDFGIARCAVPQRQKDTLFLGTKAYAAPEQFGVFRSDEKSDIYAYGMTLYYLISRHKLTSPPYKRLEPEKWQGNYSRELIDIVYACGDPHREKRPDSFSEIREQLKKLREEEKKAGEIPPNAVVYLGLRRGAGTSYVTYAHAIRLVGQGHKTALLDWSESRQISKLIYVLPGVEVKKHSFELAGLEIFPGAREGSLPIDWKEYDQILVDYGLLTAEKRKALLPYKSQLRFVCSAAPWDIVDLDEMMFNERLIDGRFILNLAEPSFLEEMQREYPETEFELFPYRKSWQECEPAPTEKDGKKNAVRALQDKIRRIVGGGAEEKAPGG